jgi:hypothetical protein
VAATLAVVQCFWCKILQLFKSRAAAGMMLCGHGTGSIALGVCLLQGLHSFLVKRRVYIAIGSLLCKALGWQLIDVLWLLPCPDHVQWHMCHDRRMRIYICVPDTSALYICVSH